MQVTQVDIQTFFYCYAAGVSLLALYLKTFAPQEKCDARPRIVRQRVVGRVERHDHTIE